MFVYDRGIRLASSGVSVDFQTRQRLGFISHAHGDHMARHQHAMCTSATSALYQRRMGERPVRLLEYGESCTIRDDTMTSLPAGHMWGSSMLLVESGERKLLYTGDFQLATARTAAPVESLPQADILIMESTFGQPRWTLPALEETESALVGRIEQAWRENRVPVLFAYATGKSQELIALLNETTDARVLQHPQTASITNVYRRSGCDLPAPVEYQPGQAKSGDVVLLPPRKHHSKFMPCPERCFKMAVTGWGLDPRTRHRLEVDDVIPLSDHADFPQLLQLVERVAPRIVFCTHGPAEFVDELRSRGYDAWPLDEKSGARCHALAG